MMEEHVNPENTTEDPVPKRRRFPPGRGRLRVPKRWWLAASAGLVAIGIGFGGGYLSTQLSGDRGRLADEMAQLSQQVEQLREAVGVPVGAGEAGESGLADLGVSTTDRMLDATRGAGTERTIRSGEAGESGLADLGPSITDRVLDATRAAGTERTIRSIESLAARFENDRLLLAEMRKAPPEDAKEIRLYWSNIKPIAVRSDPSLAPMIDRVEQVLPTYLEWISAKPGTEREATRDSPESDAKNYLEAVDDFWEAALLVVIDRIDVLVELALG